MADNTHSPTYSGCREIPAGDSNWVILRTRNIGVVYGKLLQHDPSIGRMCVEAARQVHYWDGGALNTIEVGTNLKIKARLSAPSPLPLDIYEKGYSIQPLTDFQVKVLNSIPNWDHADE